MEKLILIFFHVAMMRFSAAEELKRNLNGVVGGNVTFPDPLLELGFLLEGRRNIASVNDRKLQFVEEIYTNKLHWNRNSGLFTITDLQKSDSGDYKIDSKRGRVFYTSYNLTVYDGAPTPAVETLTVSSDSCWLLCSVDKATSLLWYKDQEVQNQNSSASSLPITVHKEDRDSSYRCVAANPAENKTLHVNVRTACGFNSSDAVDDNRLMKYWNLISLPIKLAAFMALTAVMVRRRNPDQTNPQTRRVKTSRTHQNQQLRFMNDEDNISQNPPGAAPAQDVCVSQISIIN
ncbi:CD48 antigen-like [Fundulus heteroclitus]|uniref:CD48 antigen-like n=1 Tax=Fundulus heteroclitus TaxID=8078 RepID=UPI00165BD65A|nr:CD48 antigen-like [Fundulus heteroclitus]